MSAIYILPDAIILLLLYDISITLVSFCENLGI